MQGAEFSHVNRLPRLVYNIFEPKRDRLQIRPQVLQRPARIFQASGHRIIEFAKVQIRAKPKPHTLDPGIDVSRQIRHRHIDGGGIVPHVPGHALQKQAGVADSARQRPWVIQADGVGINAFEADAAIRGLEAHNAVARGGVADRPSRIRARGPWAEKGGHGCARATAGATGRTRGVPRVARGAVPGIIAGGASGKFVGVALAQDNGSGLFEQGHGSCVFSRNIVPVK